MRVTGVIPGTPTLPELLSFRCDHCGNLLTAEPPAEQRSAA
jgi:hypothetical protein